jgi:cysteine sulfinate desulfinase/cysteine desulfurase-like protein
MKKLLSKFFTSRVRRVYLDYAGATPVSAVAEVALIEAMTTYGNPSGIHREGVEAGRLLDTARAMCSCV